MPRPIPWAAPVTIAACSASGAASRIPVPPLVRALSLAGLSDGAINHGAYSMMTFHKRLAVGLRPHATPHYSRRHRPWPDGMNCSPFDDARELADVHLALAAQTRRRRMT